MQMSPLTGVKVLEVGTGVSGAYAGLILAGLGADVARLGGFDSPGKAAEVAEADEAYFSRGKVLVGDHASLADLIALADVLITDLPPAGLRELGLPTSEDELDNLKPGMVQVSITSMGLEGPQADYATSDITDWAAGGIGAMSRELRRSTDASPAPVLAPGRQPEMLGGIAGAIGVFAALREVGAGGGAVLVDVSRVEVQAAMAHHSFPAWIYSGIIYGTTGSPMAEIGLMLEASDGLIYIRAVEERMWDALADWVDEDPEMDSTPLRLGPTGRDMAQIREMMTPWARRLPAAQMLVDGQARRIPVAIPGSLAATLESPQLEARNALRDLDLDGTTVRAPGVPLVEPASREPATPLSASELVARWS